ncbi:pseudouridine synthase [Mesomycoplasma neurolyticum]|uniref:RNA pseudouridylate synthase n=1 Tax=Mesomycoplasma neurolyticum TaxID=2120 RepID=A0A449A5Z2_9BACT|nr:RluA family pseudouridine synthase [Mesomycoplasma neurolyticum]VEU59675.1 Pseudouridylate synthase [Mesomycoplasma neurolyticum]
MKKFIATDNDAGKTLFKFLTKVLNNVPLSKIEKIFRKKEIKINQQKTNNKKYIVQKNDEILVYSLDEKKFNQKFIEFDKNLVYNFDILYEDENILIISKKINVAIHSEANSLDNQVLSYLNFAQTNSFCPSHIGRIDKATSGIVVYAKNYKSLVELKKKQKFFQKIYCFKSTINLEKPIKISLKLEKNEKLKKMVVSEKSKTIATTFFYQEKSEKYAKLITGKKHQIRVTLAHLKHPIEGDLKYGGRKSSRLFLHSWKIKFLNLENELKYLNNKEFIDEKQW